MDIKVDCTRERPLAYRHKNTGYIAFLYNTGKGTAIVIGHRDGAYETTDIFHDLRTDDSWEPLHRGDKITITL